MLEVYEGAGRRSMTSPRGVDARSAAAGHPCACFTSWPGRWSPATPRTPPTSPRACRALAIRSARLTAAPVSSTRRPRLSLALPSSRLGRARWPLPGFLDARPLQAAARRGTQAPPRCGSARRSASRTSCGHPARRRAGRWAQTRRRGAVLIHAACFSPDAELYGRLFRVARKVRAALAVLAGDWRELAGSRRGRRPAQLAPLMSAPRSRSSSRGYRLPRWAPLAAPGADG
jgi:hypothetical protein